MELTKNWQVKYFVDDMEREPYLVHYETNHGDYVLGLKDCPDTPQDFETPERTVEKLPNARRRSKSKNYNS